MKKTLAGRLAVLVVAATVLVRAAAPGFAQYSGQMKVKVPFNFAVENERLPAGEYTVERVANGRMRIHSSDGDVATSFIAIRVEGKATFEEAHFIFHRYGSEYFLAKIWTPGQNVGWEIMQGRLEMELAKKKTITVQTATLIGR